MTMNSKTIFPSMMRNFLLLLASIIVPFLGMAQDDIPTLKGDRLVYDEGSLLSKEDSAQLNQQLVQYADTTSTQIAVVIINTLDGYAVDDYAIRLAQKNGIGQQGKDNGVLILIARNEKKISIQVGYGLEGVINDGLAGQIIREYMRPAFKKDQYFEGISAAVNVIMKLASGEYTADDVKGQQKDFNPAWLLPLFFVFFFLFRMFRRRGNYAEDFTGRGYHRTGPIWFGGGFGGGGGSFGGGGGGFGGFGGGGFGGGGASGGW